MLKIYFQKPQKVIRNPLVDKGNQFETLSLSICGQKSEGIHETGS